jgi:hypothetical protein
MSIDVRTIESKKDLKRFVKFPFKIYKGSANWVPLMIMDDMEVFSPRKNPAHERADSRLFLAYRDGKPVGRIVGIISRVANEKYQTRNIRFGWFEAINDYEVAEALFKAVENWGKENGMETVTGPLGYTDLDPEGMLIEGFDELPTIASNYNHPYYQELLEKYGFEKEIDYIEFKAKIPSEDEIPAKLLRLADRIKQRGSLNVLEFKRKRHMIRRGEELFYLLDEAFDEIYGSVPLSDKQIKYYVNKYIFYVHKNLLKAITNEKDEMVGFMIAMPSLSRAFQKAKGRLFPFGWYHLLKALKTYETLDFYLAGVKKKYRGIGVDLLMVIEVAKSAHRMGFKYSESNLELETNTKIHGLWKYFNPTQHKRRRIFKKRIA